MKKTNPITVVLDCPTSVPKILVFANGVHDAMAANTSTFPAPTPSLVVFATDIGGLTTAETNAKTRAQGAVATRDEKLQVVLADLQQLKSYVQQLASATPAQAATIAQAANMRLRAKGTRSKTDLAAKQKVSGSVELVAKVASGDHAHEWQYSLDGKTWANAPPSLQGKTTVSNLQTGVLTYFRHRAVTKTGPGDWSQPVSLLVS